MGRFLVMAGLVLLALGILTTFLGRLPFRIGRLPGDIVIRWKNGTFYFPLATSMLLSFIATVVLLLLRRR